MTEESKVQKICPSIDCAGCGACVAACSFKAISITEDAEGFFVPVISQTLCKGCRQCLKTCPVLNPVSAEKSNFNMAWHLDREVLERCSSGGVFDALATFVFDRGGVVFGAHLDQRKLELEHVCIDEIASLDSLRRSKYFQSRTDRAFVQVLQELLSGKWVLFTGTPCQIAGLLSYVGSGPIRDKLLTMDVLCHGVTNRRIVDSYIKCKEKKQGALAKAISFRSKRGKLGWAAGCGPTTIWFARGDEDWCVVVDKGADGAGSFFAGYNRNLFLRESCYQCKYCCTARISDFTAADFWGVDRKKVGDYQYKQGVSLLLTNTDRARELLEEISRYMHIEPIDEAEAIQKNGAFTRPPFRPELRNRVFADLNNRDFDSVVFGYYWKDILSKKAKNAVKRIIGDSNVHAIKKLVGKD